MRQGFKSEHWSDANGNPAGGVSFGHGFTISWQNGPLGTGEMRKAPNGAFVEDVLAAVKERIEYYQRTKFECPENALVLINLDRALQILDSRTKKREAAKIEGTHQVG